MNDWNGKHVHFVGIGGISMSGLAMMLLDKGCRVSGSDWHLSPLTDKLAALGADIFQGHAAQQVHGADLVVYTAAAPQDNPELVEARRLNIPLWERARLLDHVMKQYPHSIGVAGTHGKSSTSSMIASIFVEAQLDPAVHLGAELPLIGGSARPGSGDVFITEACEYKDSFLLFPPTVAVILNIDNDHLDYFKDIDHIQASFAKYVSMLPQDGFAIGFGDDPRAREVVENARCAHTTYGYEPHNDWRISNADHDEKGCAHFDLTGPKGQFVRVAVGVAGMHNALNAAAALVTADRFGVDLQQAAASIAGYHGAGRRFQKAATVNGADVIHDYAHHPTEIKASLEAGRLITKGKLRCVFQPHTYTRTRLLFDPLVEALATADEVIMPDIYAAREAADGVTSSLKVVEALQAKGIPAVYQPDFAAISALLHEELQPGDVALILGAGDIEKLTHML